MRLRIRACWSIALLLCVGECHRPFVLAATPTALADPNRIVVLMSIDGLANFYMVDPAAEMPTIHKLAREGAKAASMRASDPTVTWPNHTTLVTGVSPAVHGVLGNNYFDRVKGEKVTLVWDPVFDMDELVKVPTIFDLAKAAGLKTASIRWPVTRGARSIDWNSPDLGLDALVLKYTTPSLFKECKEAGFLLAGDYDGTGPDEGIDRRNKAPEDPMWTNVFNMVLHKHRPNLALLHVIDVDHKQHSHGPRSAEAYEAIKVADGQIREVWEQLQKDFPGKATFIIVSDHGFSANKIAILPNVILRQAGLVEAKDDKVTGGPVQVLVQGGSAFVYVLDEANRDAIVERIKKEFAKVDGVSSVVSAEEFPAYGIADPRREPRAPDIVLFAKMNYFFGHTAAGSLPHHVKPERKGSHGHDSNFPDMKAMFIAWGAGIRPGAELGHIDNRSVAPTIAKLLGVDMPGVESKPLTEALAE
jgi:predicted AlkP superfamily pyrophosphatase or phosphodiesterase